MRGRLFAAFAAVYIIWGSTYLAIRFAVETLPPLLMAGARFGLSGLILLAFERMRVGTKSPGPTSTDWRTGLISSALLLLAGNGGVVLAEQRVSSGMAALLVAVVPLWMVLLEWWRPLGKRPPALVFVGLAMGLAGLVLLINPSASSSGAAVDIGGAVILTLASLCWAVGSLYTKHAPKPSTALYGAAAQMIAGGLWLVAAGALAGEFSTMDLAHASTRSILGFVYLTTFGSLVGFTAYFYLLAHTSAAKASTYAYVNPVVAVFLGWALAHEEVTVHAVVAATVILAGVAIITIARDDEISEATEERAAA